MKRTANKIIVIGGNDSGLSAAGRAKRLQPDLDITVFERSPHIGYASCALPYMISGAITTPQLAGHSPQEIRDKRQLNVHNHTAVNAINTLKKTVIAQDLQSGNVQEFKYDKLLFATGADPVIPTPLNSNHKNVFVLRNYNDALKLKSHMDSYNPKTAVIVGGSYIGIEMAEALYQKGLNVTVIDKAPQLFSGLVEPLSKDLQALLESKGVNFLISNSIQSLNEDNGFVKSLQLEKSKIVTPDIIIAAAGIKPATRIATDAGIPVGPSGALIVNDYMQTRRMDVFAVGDCVETRNLVTNKMQWIPLAGIASKQGRIAGTNLAGKREAFPGALGTAMIKAFGVEFGLTGLNVHQAKQAGFDPVLSSINHKNKPPYVSGSADVSVHLITDRKSSRILGGQVWGTNDAAMRLNILAVAITAGMKSRDLEFMDFGYTPMISNIWEPLSVAGNRAQKNEVIK